MKDHLILMLDTPTPDIKYIPISDHTFWGQCLRGVTKYERWILALRFRIWGLTLRA